MVTKQKKTKFQVSVRNATRNVLPVDDLNKLATSQVASKRKCKKKIQTMRVVKNNYLALSVVE